MIFGAIPPSVMRPWMRVSGSMLLRMPSMLPNRWITAASALRPFLTTRGRAGVPQKVQNGESDVAALPDAFPEDNARENVRRRCDSSAGAIGRPGLSRLLRGTGRTQAPAKSARARSNAFVAATIYCAAALSRPRRRGAVFARSRLSMMLFDGCTARRQGRCKGTGYDE